MMKLIENHFVGLFVGDGRPPGLLLGGPGSRLYRAKTPKLIKISIQKKYGYIFDFSMKIDNC